MSDSAPGSGPGVVAACVVRVGDDVASDLRVQVKVENETISLRTDVLEVGSWPIRDFSVKRITADRFVISIDGETLSFYPDEPDVFRRLDFVGKKRAGRIRKTKADQRAAAAAKDKKKRRGLTMKTKTEPAAAPPTDALTDAGTQLDIDRSTLDASPPRPGRPPESAKTAASDSIAPATTVNDPDDGGALLEEEDDQVSVKATAEPVETHRDDIEDIASDTADAQPIEPYELPGTAALDRDDLEAAGTSTDRVGDVENKPKTLRRFRRSAKADLASPKKERAVAETPRHRGSSLAGPGGDGTEVAASEQALLVRGWNKERERFRRVIAVAAPDVRWFRRRAGSAFRRGFVWSRWRVKLAGLWVVDKARQTDVPLLDRLPVVTDEMRLRPGHEHNFVEHTAGAGLTRYVYRGCGKLRLSLPDRAPEPGDE